MSISILQPARRFGGDKVRGLYNLVTVRRKDGSWSLCISWSFHVKACKYGPYWNSNNVRGGLKGCLNLPVLGDFALWV